MDLVSHLDLGGERFTAVYHLTAGEGESPLSEAEAMELARDIGVEQTVEYPRDLVEDRDIREQIFGRVESLAARGEEPGWEAVISFAVETSGLELPQLFNVLFGNISLKRGIRLVRFEPTKSLLASMPGPRFGREGLRSLLGVPDRPLLCTALKPMGLPPEALADLAYTLARGGIDLIKDDHGLADQSFCTFEQRLTGCVEAVARANRETGGHCRYLPNVTAPSLLLWRRALQAREAGAGGVLISPGLVGFDTMRALAADDRFGLPILSHPALLGSFVASDREGISHHALFGQMMRLAGADACIFPHTGGRFPFTARDCRELAEGTAVDMGPIRTIFPVPAGGMHLDRIREMVAFYGDEVILLIGGDLHRQGPDLEQSCRRFVQMVQELAGGSQHNVNGPVPSDR